MVAGFIVPGKCAAFHDTHPVGHAGRDVQFPRGVAVLLRQIHAGHGATVLLRDPSRRTTDAAANIQDRFPARALRAMGWYYQAGMEKQARQPN